MKPSIIYIACIHYFSNPDRTPEEQLQDHELLSYLLPSITSLLWGVNSCVTASLAIQESS